LAKQIEANGQAIARLTLTQTENRQESPPNPTSFEASTENIFYKEKPVKEKISNRMVLRVQIPNKAHDGRGRPKITLPKMSSSQFSGKNLAIWKEKCQNYFTIFKIPPSMWTTYASMNMDVNVTK
jgi:hypothetical protein